MNSQDSLSFSTGFFLKVSCGLRYDYFRNNNIPLKAEEVLATLSKKLRRSSTLFLGCCFFP